MNTYWFMVSLMSVHLVTRGSKAEVGGLQIVNNTGEAEETCLEEHAWCQRGLPPYCCGGDQFCKKKEGMLWFWCEKKPSGKEYGCGKAKQNTRIFGGNETCDGCIPWQVSIKYDLKNDGKFFPICGGTIIAPKFVMTAAHCTSHEGQPLAPERFQLAAGVTDNNDAEAIISKVEKYHDHPKYVAFGQPGAAGGLSGIYDFSILELTKPIDIGEGSKAGAVCLPQKSDMAKFKHGETDLVASGWGLGNDPKNILRDIHVPWVSESNCKKAFLRRLKEESDYKETFKQLIDKAGSEKNFADKVIHTAHLCAGYLKKHDLNWKKFPRTCFGDSGGPLTWKDPKTSTVKIVGVVSWGFASFGPSSIAKKVCKKKYHIPDEFILKDPENNVEKCCIPGYADVWAKVTEVLDWIKEVTNEDFSTDSTLKKLGDTDNQPAPKNYARNFSPAPIGLEGSLHFVPQ